MFAFGSQAHVLDTNFAPLVPLAKEARGRDWYMIVQPEHASETAKRSYLKRYLPKWAVLRQRRDSETSDAFEARSKRFELYTILLEGLVNDSESVKSFVKCPRAKTGYEATFQVMFRKDTSSAMAIQSLVPNGSRIAKPASGSFASIACNVKAVKPLRDFLTAWAGVQSDALTGVVLKQLGRSEVLNSHVQLEHGEGNSGLTATGVIPWSTDTTLRNLTSSIEGSNIDGGQIALPLPIATQAPYILSAKLQSRGTRCIFAVGQPVDTEAVQIESGPRQRIFSAKLDLSRVAGSPDSGVGVKELLGMLEELYNENVTGVPAYVKVVPQPIDSVLPMLAGKGDWTATLDIDVVNRRGLRVRLKVGRELYGLWGARKRLSKRSRERSLGDD
jgi:hypothetical protein